MAKKRLTKEIKELMSRVVELGCAVCGRPPEIHHLTGGGMGLKSTEFIGLCPPHHRTGGYGVAVHAGTKTWEKNFGTQLDLYQRQMDYLNE